MQATCDHNHKFTSVYCKWPGSTHDAFVLRRSELWRIFENNSNKGIILGDSAYPCRYWLMTPFCCRSNHLTPAQERYNSAHKKTRVVVENAFGQLKRRFGLLHQENRRSLEHISKDIVACFILHNYAKDQQQPDFIDNVYDCSLFDMNCISNDNDSTCAANNRRTQIVATYFS